MGVCAPRESCDVHISSAENDCNSLVVVLGKAIRKERGDGDGGAGFDELLGPFPSVAHGQDDFVF